MLDPRWIVLITLVASLALFLRGTLRYDLVALLVVLALVVSRTLEPKQAFAGFASEAVIVVACMSVFGHALSSSGVAETVCQRLFANQRIGEAGVVLRLAFIAGLFAAFMSDAAVVAILLPIAGALSRNRQIPLSRLLIPVSFGCFLGDLLIVVGSAKNIALNGAVIELGGQPFGMFEFTPFGFVVFGVGLVYLAGPARALLPRSEVGQSLSRQYRVPKFVTEVPVEASSALINRSVADLAWPRDYEVTVLGIAREGGEGKLFAPGPYNRIRRGDTLILQGGPEDVLRLARDFGLEQTPTGRTADPQLSSTEVQLVECVIPAGSELAGSTLLEADFRARTGLNVVAISKHGEVQGEKLSRTPLDVGDTLLVQGHRRDIERARRERELLVLGEVELRRFGREAWISVALLTLVILIATIGLLPLSVAALAGAVALVLTRCVPAREVYGTIDWAVLILIGGMLALGRAFDEHQLGRALAERFEAVGMLAAHPTLAVALLASCAALLAQTTTSVGTAVILAPVALSLAETLGVSDRPLLMAVLAGANCAFLSPVANAANAMVMGPGGYRFRDFLRAGLPLTLLVLALTCLVVPILFPFELGA